MTSTSQHLKAGLSIQANQAAFSITSPVVLCSHLPHSLGAFLKSGRKLGKNPTDTRCIFTTEIRTQLQRWSALSIVGVSNQMEKEHAIISVGCHNSTELIMVILDN